MIKKNEEDLAIARSAVKEHQAQYFVCSHSALSKEQSQQRVKDTLFLLQTALPLLTRKEKKLIKNHAIKAGVIKESNSGSVKSKATNGRRSRSSSKSRRGKTHK